MKTETTFLALHLQAFFIFAVIALIINAIAFLRKYYRLTPSKPPLIDFKQVLISFAIYFASTIILTLFIQKMIINIYGISNYIPNQIIPLRGWSHFIAILFASLFLYYYNLYRDRKTFFHLWKDRSYEKKRSILFDFGFGVMSWIIAFPVVAAIGQLFDILIYLLFDVTQYEQIVITYLRDVLHYPLTLTLALTSILIIAPFIEEFLFRGLLQAWLKRTLGLKSAIALTGIAFAFFHFSFSQKVGNLTLLISLFILSCFLSFLYERQRSLFAPIGLHFAFNLISTLRIFFIHDL